MSDAISISWIRLYLEEIATDSDGDDGFGSYAAK